MQTSEIDNITPGEKWAFDAEVTECFEDMLRRSIPQYDVMRQSTFDLACRYVQRGTAIVDVGCSRGDALAPFVDKYGAQNRFIGLEVSEPMLVACRKRFEGYIACSVVDIRNLDLRTEYPDFRASITLSVLTMQFVPIEYRQRLLRQIYHSTLPGGAFLLVEKVLGATADIDAVMVENYYNLKARNGYSQDAIDRKRFSLEGVLVPVAAKWNEELLIGAGFREVDCFWRWMNFAGWIAVK